jgi:molecular chaperone HscB
MNYFEFFQIPISLKVDEVALKKIFYANSRKYHPDFFAAEDASKQTEMLELSSLNNEAYKTLADFDKRMKYVLQLNGVLNEEGKNEIPQDFLLEMMDINEALMELEFDFDTAKFYDIKKQLKEKETTLYAVIEPLVENFDETKLDLVKEYYLKKKYLLRIEENISNFAAR